MLVNALECFGYKWYQFVLHDVAPSIAVARGASESWHAINLPSQRLTVVSLGAERSSYI